MIPMLTRILKPTAMAVLLLLAALPCASFSQASRDKKRDKKKDEKLAGAVHVGNYEHGIFFQSDGDIPSGPCFRINGHVSGGDFFWDLKRYDYDEGDTLFQRGDKIVTLFPQKLLLEFTLHDFPCSVKLDEFHAHRYLTRREIEALQVTMYWKTGLALRRVEQAGRPQLTVQHRPGPAYATEEGLPAQYEWLFVYEIASTGVPVTDSLVVVLRTPEGKIAARFGARM